MQNVLLTGITGYIAKHIAVELLDAGYSVRGSMRTMKRVQEVNAAVANGLKDPSKLRNLSFCELDLTNDRGWSEAFRGIDALVHTASPFPMVQPKNEDELIKPAVDGTLRALRTAKSEGVQRVIVTSSMAAIGGTPKEKTYDENDWTDVNVKGVAAYTKSKTLAEKAAWDFIESEAPDIALTAVNPGFVVGAPLDNEYGTSIAVFERILRGKDPMVPRTGFTSVDVKDVAAMHVAALEDEATHGQRILCVDRFLWFQDITKAIKKEFPDRRIATRVAPDMLIRLLGLIDPAVRSIVPSLGQKQTVDNSRGRTILKRDFQDSLAASVATAKFLVDKETS